MASRYWADDESKELEDMLKDGKKTYDEIVDHFVEVSGRSSRAVQKKIQRFQFEQSIGYIAGAKNPKTSNEPWTEKEISVFTKEVTKFEFEMEPSESEWVEIIRALRKQTKTKRSLQACQKQLRNIRHQIRSKKRNSKHPLVDRRKKDAGGSKGKRQRRGGDKSTSDVAAAALVSPPGQARSDDASDEEAESSDEGDQQKPAPEIQIDEATAKELAVFDAIQECHKKLFLSNKTLRSDNAKLKTDVKYWFEKHQALDSVANTILKAAQEDEKQEEDEAAAGGGEEDAPIAAASQDKWSDATAKVPSNTDGGGPDFISDTCRYLSQIESQNAELASDNGVLKEEINRWKTKHDKLKGLMASMASTLQQATGKKKSDEGE